MHQEHDQRAKRICEDALDLFGEVVREQEVDGGDAQRIDIWFRRTQYPESVPRHLVIWDNMFPDHRMLEAYSQAVSVLNFWISHRKQYAWQQRLGKKQRNVDLPWLWLLSPGRPEQLMERYAWQPLPGFAGGGFYSLGKGFSIGLVVICELPPGPETLVLRLMGRGQGLLKAMAELAALPEDEPESKDLRRFVAYLQKRVQNDKEIDEADKEEFMTAAWAEFEKWEEGVRTEGRTEVLAQTVIRVLARRFDYRDVGLEQRVRAETRQDLLNEWLDEALCLNDREAMLRLVGRIKDTSLPADSQRDTH